MIKVKLEEKTDTWYWDTSSDKAIFASLLMDFDYDDASVYEVIKNLYSFDYGSYYYSTQSKNNAFIAFVKYLEKYGKNNVSDIKIILNGKTKNMTVTGDLKSYTSTLPLKDALVD